ncbi:hypothetical protein HZC07_04250, partial [Candidatus Micrarchaeota archaeon]|nr:hypothetical protein [Candidatus Micrarchaeota archaeon]
MGNKFRDKLKAYREDMVRRLILPITRPFRRAAGVAFLSGAVLLAQSEVYGELMPPVLLAPVAAIEAAEKAKTLEGITDVSRIPAFIFGQVNYSVLKPDQKATIDELNRSLGRLGVTVLDTTRPITKDMLQAARSAVEAVSVRPDDTTTTRTTTAAPAAIRTEAPITTGTPTATVRPEVSAETQAERDRLWRVAVRRDLLVVLDTPLAETKSMPLSIPGPSKAQKTQALKLLKAMDKAEKNRKTTDRQIEDLTRKAELLLYGKDQGYAALQSYRGRLAREVKKAVELQDQAKIYTEVQKQLETLQAISSDRTKIPVIRELARGAVELIIVSVNLRAPARTELVRVLENAQKSLVNGNVADAQKNLGEAKKLYQEEQKYYKKLFTDYVLAPLQEMVGIARTLPNLSRPLTVDVVKLG